MSVASEISRIKSNIADAYTEAEAKGATMPVTENSDNLADTVASIQSTGNALDMYFADTLEYANIPNATRLIANFFQNKTNLQSVIMPNVTSMGNYCFAGCKSLRLEELPDRLTSIPASGFFNCLNITLTKLPSGITSIGPGAFSNCLSIPYLDFSEFETIPALVNVNAFVNTTFPFYFRDQTQLDAYAAETNWNTLSSRFQIKP